MRGVVLQSVPKPGAQRAGSVVARAIRALCSRPERAYCTNHAQAYTLAPLVLARSTAPRHALPSSQQRAKPPWQPTATPTELLAAHRRPQRASAMVGAAKATPARHLPLGTAQAYPLARRLALVASMLPCRIAWWFAVVLIAGCLGTDLHRLYKGPGAPSSPRSTSSDPPRATLASIRGGEGLLPRVRPVRSPPSPGRFRHHQGLSFSNLSTKNSPSLSRVQPLDQFWSETTAAQKSLCHRSPPPPRSSPPATPTTSGDPATTGRTA